MQATSQPAGLPAPTGRYQVGRVSFELVDPARVEIYSSNPQDRRELVVWVWYPAAPAQAPTAPLTLWCPFVITSPTPARQIRPPLMG